MLEFYQAYATYEDLMDLTEELFCHVAGKVTGEPRAYLSGNGDPFCPALAEAPFQRVAAVEIGELIVRSGR